MELITAKRKKKKKAESLRPLIKLQWLPLKFHVNYNVLYLLIISCWSPETALCSAEPGVLLTPRVSRSSTNGRCLSYLWKSHNNLPENIRHGSSISGFKCRSDQLYIGVHSWLYAGSLMCFITNTLCSSNLLYAVWKSIVLFRSNSNTTLRNYHQWLPRLSRETHWVLLILNTPSVRLHGQQ